MTPNLRGKKIAAALMIFAYPLAAFFLLYGGLGLEIVETSLWGGVTLTLVVAVIGDVVSLPLALLLALGRRARGMPVLRAMSSCFIEFVRGVPLITMLFMASVMLPLFLPEGANFDKLLRALIAVTLFQAAYLAEVIRGGLQTLPPGQEEAARAMGLGYWRATALVTAPQALKVSIPGIVNSFIALLKDTTLVLIIGLFDVLGMVQLSAQDSKWISPSTTTTGYAMAAFFFGAAALRCRATASIWSASWRPTIRRDGKSPPPPRKTKNKKRLNPRAISPEVARRRMTTPVVAPRSGLNPPRATAPTPLSTPEQSPQKKQKPTPLVPSLLRWHGAE